MTPLGYAEPTDPRYVYILLDTDGQAVYVGCTVNLPRRLTQHAKKDYWADVDHVEATRWPDEATGYEVEKRTIAALNPRVNSIFTDHPTPRTRPCPTCRSGKHHACSGVNVKGEPCPCSVCARLRVTA